MFRNGRKPDFTTSVPALEVMSTTAKSYPPQGIWNCTDMAENTTTNLCRLGGPIISNAVLSTMIIMIMTISHELISLKSSPLSHKQSIYPKPTPFVLPSLSHPPVKSSGPHSPIGWRGKSQQSAPRVRSRSHRRPGPPPRNPCSRPVGPRFPRHLVMFRD